MADIYSSDLHTLLVEIADLSVCQHPGIFNVPNLFRLPNLYIVDNESMG